MISGAGPFRNGASANDTRAREADYGAFGCGGAGAVILTFMSRSPQVAHVMGQRRSMKHQLRPRWPASRVRSRSRTCGRLAHRHVGQVMNAPMPWSISLPIVSIVAG